MMELGREEGELTSPGCRGPPNSSLKTGRPDLLFVQLETSAEGRFVIFMP